MDDRDVLIVEEYIRTHQYEPDLKQDQYLFDLQSYSNFAANEILERVVCESMKLPAHITGVESLSAAEIVEIFIDEMDYYAHMSSDYRIREIFEIARDEGKCILMYICSFD